MCIRESTEQNLNQVKGKIGRSSNSRAADLTIKPGLAHELPISVASLLDIMAGKILVRLAN